VTEHAETMIVGKWLYMSPEATMNQQIDHRSDLFSLGVILYLLCSRCMPFIGAEPKEIVRKIRAGAYKPLQEIAPVPDRLARLVDRLLAPNPTDRPQTGQEVATELLEITRSYGLESSNSKIASFLGGIFPNVSASADPERASLQNIVRVFPDDMSLTMKDSSPVSIASGSGSNSNTSSRMLAPVDVSQTFHRTSGEQSAQVPITGTVQKQKPPKLPTLQGGGNAIKILLLILVAVIGAVGAYFVVTYR